MIRPGGVLYLLLIEDNRPKDVMKIMKENSFDFDGIIMKKRAANEMQYIFKFIKIWADNRLESRLWSYQSLLLISIKPTSPSRYSILRLS